ncbi:MAG: hypothetical protein E7668_03045 [Ruminococcaceae bacterium]|nr:hypothetical protein [Oscillospiraceae bacterium]
MDLRKVFKNMLTESCVYFALISALYCVLMLIVNVSEQEVLLSALTLLLIFVFSVLAMLAQTLYRYKALNGAARLFLHYAILALAFYLCFLLPASMTASQVLIGLTVFTLIYALVMGLSALFLRRLRKNAAREEIYQSQFKKAR